MNLSVGIKNGFAQGESNTLSFDVIDNKTGNHRLNYCF